MSITTKSLFITLAAGLLLLPGGVLAAPYGSGEYGACKYSQGCVPITPQPTGNPSAGSDVAPITSSANHLVLIISIIILALGLLLFLLLLLKRRRQRDEDDNTKSIQ